MINEKDQDSKPNGLVSSFLMMATLLDFIGCWFSSEVTAKVMCSVGYLVWGEILPRHSGSCHSFFIFFPVKKGFLPSST